MTTNVHPNPLIKSIESQLSAFVSALSPEGATVLCTNLTGLAPAGHERASGTVVPAGVYEQHRVVMTSGPTLGFSCANTRAVYKFSTGGVAGSVFDYATGATTAIAAWPGPAGYLPGAFAIDDEYLYVFGGRNSVSPYQGVSTVHRLNLATGAWEQRASLPASVSNSALIIRQNGTVLCVGGVTADVSIPGLSSQFTGSVYSYDPAANAHTLVTTMPAKSWGAKFLQMQSGDLLLSAPASRVTTDANAISASGRSFLISPSNVFTEVDDVAPEGRAFYEIASGRVVAMSSNLASSKVFDFSLPRNSQGSTYAISALPGYATGLFTSAQLPPVNLDGMLPCFVTGAPALLLFYTGTVAPAASSAFYIRRS